VALSHGRRALTPAIRHGTGFVQARVSDDGKEVLFRLEKLGWFTMPLPVQDAVLPEWFLRYAETLAGNRLTSTGRLEELDLTEYEKASRRGRSRPRKARTPPHASSAGSPPIPPSARSIRKPTSPCPSTSKPSKCQPRRRRGAETLSDSLPHSPLPKTRDSIA
jgi:hypothetical protein